MMYAGQGQGLHGTCFTRTAYLAHRRRTMEGGKRNGTTEVTCTGKANSGSRNFPVAIGSGRDNAAAICRGADPEILASNKP
ncbi:uncharacterized protein BO88DRAFT_259515 [Aspergillus vadensis CBS 113365]|uniref:Uncharacterized protein n=1 Tax=Aspergillus vadensis (strain CBS 113365 / IMI 142717 / IBT 24658) TaxID=1448311 RepID=A0A319BC65_ASPVC|nr:hypothetical protein BO88DRAFT_259515 [Aspergillus vadensis CBS 113365]PYH70277.1 hypothetical protein BO88DRAFT_259515 [Aspergillus vadensis CBS 113365]